MKNKKILITGSTGFVGIGSQAEYGRKKKVIYETSKLNPNSNYGKIKVRVHNKIKKYCKLKKIRFVWLRIFTGYGPGSSNKWLIPYTITNILSNKNIIKFTSGKQIYNFIYISDITIAIIKSLFNININGEYNLAFKISYKIKTVINLIFSILKTKSIPNFGKIEYRSDQSMNFFPSISKLKKDFKWEPKIGIKQGLKKNIMYLKKF